MMSGFRTKQQLDALVGGGGVCVCAGGVALGGG